MYRVKVPTPGVFNSKNHRGTAFVRLTRRPYKIELPAQVTLPGQVVSRAEHLKFPVTFESEEKMAKHFSRSIAFDGSSVTSTRSSSRAARRPCFRSGTRTFCDVSADAEALRLRRQVRAGAAQRLPARLCLYGAADPRSAPGMRPSRRRAV